MYPFTEYIEFQFNSSWFYQYPKLLLLIKMISCLEAYEELGAYKNPTHNTGDTVTSTER